MKDCKECWQDVVPSWSRRQVSTVVSFPLLLLWILLPSFRETWPDGL